MGSSLLYISIAYYMQKGGGWVQIACKIAYVLNGRPPTATGACNFIYALLAVKHVNLFVLIIPNTFV